MCVYANFDVFEVEEVNVKFSYSQLEFIEMIKREKIEKIQMK